MQRPEKTEYASFYETYVSKVEETDIIAALNAQIGEIRETVSAISDDKADFAYAEGKWTIKEVLGHLIDGERVFAYRALRFSRGDETPLAGFEENLYVAGGNFAARSLADLTEELTLSRRANVIFFQNLAEKSWSNSGTASENLVTVRALAFIMVGHIRHHLRILRDRYLTES